MREWRFGGRLSGTYFNGEREEDCVKVFLFEYVVVTLTVCVTPVGNVVILVVSVRIGVILTEYEIVGHEDDDDDSVVDTEAVFVRTAESVDVELPFTQAVGRKEVVIVVEEDVVLDILVEAVYVAEVVELFDGFEERVIVGL